MEEALSSDNSESQPENGDSIARRPVWNRPLNGVVEPVTVMGGAVSWPALSETTRSVPRSSSSDASRIVSDGSVPSSQAPIISQPPQRSPHNNANNVHGNSGGNNPNPARLRRNRGGGGGGGGGGRGSFSVSGPSQGPFNPLPLPMPPPFPVIEVPFGAIPTVLDNSVRGPRPIGGGVGPSHSGNDHPTQRINTRRSNNYGPRPRGDGQYHNNHGGRRDHDRREVRHPPPPPYAPPPMGYMPPPLPPGAASFMAPPPMMLFPGQMGFNMEPPFVYVPPMPPETFRTMPMVPPPPPVIFPPANENPLPNPNLSPNPLPNMIVNQIDYYFSDANLVKDPFLKSQMDDNGWVPISLVASFPRVLRLTNDIPLIVESLRHHSTAVEIQGDMIRRRNDWSLWIGSNGDPSTSGNISAPENALATSLNEVSLDDATAHVNGNLDDAREGRLEMADGQLPEDSTIQSGLANGDHADDHSNSL